MSATTTTEKKHAKKAASKKAVVHEGTQAASSAPAAVEAVTPAAASTAAATPAPVVASTTGSSLSDRVAQATVYLEAAMTALKLNAPALSPLQRKRLAKFRKGGEKYVPQLANMAGQWGVSVRTQPTAAMVTNAQTVTALQPLLSALMGWIQEIQDVTSVANGDAWTTAATLYSLLKRISAKDPKLAAQIAPVAQFFKPKPVTDKGDKPKKPGSEAKRKAKEVAAAEALVAAQEPAQSQAPAAAAASATQVTPPTHS